MAWIVAPNRKLTEHFAARELACRHCGRIPSLAVMQETAEWLERVREQLGGYPMHVTSGCRCRVHNRAVGGATNSQHIYGMAVDFVLRGLSIPETQERGERLWVEGLIRGLGTYRSWTHADRGPAGRRWEGP